MKEYYVLPPERIAQEPPKVRGTSRLLIINRANGELEDRKYAQLDEFLHAGDLLVLNETKVLPARLIARLADGRERELMLTEKHAQDLPDGQARVIYRGKLRAGDRLHVGTDAIHVNEIIDGGQAVVTTERPLAEIAYEYGATPLPPYIRRDATVEDRDRYQTIFAASEGSVAAATASLNLTEELLERSEAKGVHIARLTLHVGRGTFLPIRSDSLDEHTMHEEYFEIPPETAQMIRNTRAAGGRVVAVGTTVTRALEYAAAELLHEDVKMIAGEADIFIHPGYEFQLVDVLLTNFHAPDSTVIQLAAAFVGEDLLRRSYQHALAQEYMFLSYGDSMLIV